MLRMLLVAVALVLLVALPASAQTPQCPSGQCQAVPSPQAALLPAPAYGYQYPRVTAAPPVLSASCAPTAHRRGFFGLCRRSCGRHR